MILVDIFVPSVNKVYDFQLSETTPIHTVIEEITEMISQKERAVIVGDIKELMLCDKKTQCILEKNKTLAESDIITGQSLIFIQVEEEDMGQKIAVNTTVLSKDIEVLQQQLDVVKSDLNKMYNAVQVLNGMWDGPTNKVFNNQFTRDRKDMFELCNTIQKIINCMEYAKKEYDTCEANVYNIIASISI